MLPAAIVEFVRSRALRPCKPSTAEYPYRRHLRGVAAVLVSGRLLPSLKRQPDEGQVQRLGQAVGLSAEVLWRSAELLLDLEVVEAEGGAYREGPRWEAFLGGGVTAVRDALRRGFGLLVDQATPSGVWRPTMAWSAGLDRLLQLFLLAFRGQALAAEVLPDALRQFAGLPPRVLGALRRELGLPPVPVYEVQGWAMTWLDEVGVAAMVTAARRLWWFEGVGRHGEEVTPSYEGLFALGLMDPVAPHMPEDRLEVRADLTVRAGEDLAMPVLVALLREGVLLRLDRGVEVRLGDGCRGAWGQDRPGARELCAALMGAWPLPDEVQKFLGVEGAARSIGVRACSGLIKVGDAETLARIKRSRRLGEWVEEGPPGYLIVKAGASLESFLKQCERHGYQVLAW